jgi:hypothetical protein
MPQPKLFCESSKVLLEIVSVIGFVEILRKHLKQTVIIRLVPALERIQDDQATPGFSTRANSRNTARRTPDGSSCTINTFVTAS